MCSLGIVRRPSPSEIADGFQILVGVETPRNAYYMDVLADDKAEVGSLYTRHSCFPDFFGPK